MPIVHIVKVKPGVTFDVIAPAGFRILGAIERCARALMLDLTITSGTDGAHVGGVGDPHATGEAYDVRTSDFDPATVDTIAAWLATELGSLFTVIHEHPGDTADTTAEHLHIQRLKSTIYPPAR